MKQFVTLLMFVLTGQSLFAQNVGIGTNTPNVSALLDVTSTTKGFLVPRMTSAQRIAIATPAAGLMVYETTTNSIWIYNGTGWIQQASGGASPWTLSGTNIFNTNTGRVGIGTSTPNASAELDITSTNTGLLIPRMTTLQRNAIVSPAAGLLVYDNSLKEFYHFDGGSWRQIVNTSNNLWKSSTTANFVYNNTDSIGIGTSSPDEKLHIVSGSVYVQDNRTGKNPNVIFDVPGSDQNEGGIQFKRTGDTLASVVYVEDVNVPNYLRIGVGDAGTKNDFTFNSSGEMGIGSKSPNGQLHLAAYTGDNLTINDADGIIQFSLPIIGGVTKKAFLQLSGTDDLRVGTNSGNTTGRYVVRTNGADKMVVDAGGDVGIGVDFPITKLQIAGGQDAGLTSSTNGYIMMGPGTGTNLIIDNNEIMVRNTYTSVGTLALQNNGGEVTVGARTTINKGGEALALNGNDPGMSFYQNGVFRSFINQSANELYVGVNAGNLHLDATGQIAIGAVIPAASGYKLTVTGKVICEEVKVKLSGAWPDYVFEENHALMPVEKLSEFIRQNKHLPNIPSAAEMEKNGLELGDMQKKMMEKIEELTLYIIDLQKQVDELKKTDK